MTWRTVLGWDIRHELEQGDRIRIRRGIDPGYRTWAGGVEIPEDTVGVIVGPGAGDYLLVRWDGYEDLGSVYVKQKNVEAA